VSDFPFAWYLQTVQRKVNERWSPPARGAEGRAVVVFEIGRDGAISRPEVENSSGDVLYDQAALRAITDANPFPPLPAEFKQPVLKIHLGFNFATDRG
jgi:TonB family protein